MKLRIYPVSWDLSLLLFSRQVLCNHWGTPDVPVLHYLPKFTQAQVHWVGDAIQPSHPLLPPSPPAFNLSQHQGFFPLNWLFTSGGRSVGASTSASVLPVNIQGWFPLGLTSVISWLSKGFSRVFESINLSLLSLLYGQILTSVHDYWKDYSFDHMPFVNKVMSLSL